MELYTGTHIAKLDDKRRVSIPAAFRKAAEQLVLFRHPQKPLLFGVSFEELERIYEKNAGEMVSAALANAIILKVDDAGRVVLPKLLVDTLFKGTQELVFTGAGHKFHVMDGTVWKNEEAGKSAKAAESLFEYLS